MRVSTINRPHIAVPGTGGIAEGLPRVAGGRPIWRRPEFLWGSFPGADFVATQPWWTLPDSSRLP